MQKIKILDNQFGHAPSFGCGDLNIKPDNMEWVRNLTPSPSPERGEGSIVVLTESMFHRVGECSEKIKIALMLEPPAISPKGYEDMKHPAFYNKFDYILTYNKELLALDKKFVFYPFGGCWIYPEERKLHPKTKNVSIVASHKKETPLHRLRHEVIAASGNKLDVFGNGYQKIQNKITALRDYRFQVVIENDNSDYWFTEKLIDCFVTGTIPIYVGCKDISMYFNTEGMFTINHPVSVIDGIKEAIAYLDDAVYTNCLPAIADNFERAKQYTIPENWLWENFFQKRIFRK